ncbi:Hsp33 family molecular chaperone HslO [Weissella diestrammenae]|uniref:Hsp33 family molecular chaperone HslO n=1 Tax=Weissella diestrammenae TaxID=1162633 RepID=A0A7G9T7E9_9LACO|nr:Hsp33 family molecular chaperone HslO [Weissella diestrammenae]MCM0582039.1 Hsp33 family molecular chaperone HslO [Weissella diestrammenae]QNN76024.1 Hsp33 family molecular chaperone HslO [Weissella diestrammenae]
MVDSIVRAVTNDNNFRAIALDATEMMQTAAKFHAASPLGVEILGRTLMSALLVSNAVLKGEEHLAVVIDGDGPAGKIVAEASANGLVRGYVTNAQVNAEDVATAVGNQGFLRVTKEMDENTEPFTGSVALTNGNIDDDFTFYMLTSEQIPSVVMVDIAVDTKGQVQVAGGFIVSALPDAKESALDQFYAAVENMPKIRTTLLNHQGPLGLLTKIFGKDQVKALSDEKPALFPAITKHEYAQLLGTIAMDQLLDMYTQDHGAEIVDRFTGEKIAFTAEELQSIMTQKKQREQA